MLKRGAILPLLLCVAGTVHAGQMGNIPTMVAPPAPVNDTPISSDNNAAPGKLPDCRPDWMWEPDAYMRNKPRCKDLKKTPPANLPPATPDRGEEDSGGLPPRLPGYPNHSCWAAPASCVVSTGEWGSSQMDQESRRFYTHHKNVCAHRVVVKACIERDGLKPACGMFDIEPGKTRSWDVSRSSGHYRVMHFGVLQGKDDFVCPKPPGWKEMGK